MKTLLTPEQVQELLEQAKPSIVEGFIKDIREQATWSVREAAANEISEAVKTWVRENVLPDVIAMLVESRDGLVSVATKLAPQMVEAMAASLAESFSKNLESSWNRKKIWEAMFE